MYLSVEDKYVRYIKRAALLNASLQLLEGRENESKRPTPLVDWLKVIGNRKNTKYLLEDVSCELANFEEFMEKRQELMSKSLKDILLWYHWAFRPFAQWIFY